MIQVGKKAPEFNTQAHINGGFEQINLSKYANQWVLLFFYSGDFTFV